MAESPVMDPSEEQSTDATTKTLQQADCDDSPTRVTNSNTSSETASLPDEQEQQDILLSSLARQLEFYFSPANLPRDTYLQTLQSLNDGYVPISIIANFAKVQALCSGSIQAVTKAASDHTSALEVVYISTVTNKKVPEQDENTILAVGPSVQPSLLLAPKTPIQNTIIIRDVPEEIKEEDVRGLFDKDCPPLQEVHLDVANCWFVTLDTTSRDDMMNVMLDLRKKTLKGDAVKARLKAAGTPTSPFVGTLDPNALSFPALHTPPASPSRTSGKQQKPKKQQQRSNGTKSKTRSRKNSNANKQPPQSPASPKKQQKQLVTAPPPPPLLQEESHFPALATPSVAVDNIVDKVGSSIAKPTTADAASTTTTTSSTTSSTSTPAPPAGGYAAALLKAAPPKVETKSTNTASKTTATKKLEESPTNAKLSEKTAANPEAGRVEKKEEPKEKIAPMPMSWGSGRSFAQVLKKEEQSS